MGVFNKLTGYHNRRSIRLAGHDYSLPGQYYITICTHNRELWFGNTVESGIAENEFSGIVRRCWYDLPNHYPHIQLDEFCVMPNHVHGIIRIRDIAPIHPSHFAPTNPHSESHPIVGAGSKPAHSEYHPIRMDSTETDHPNPDSSESNPVGAGSKPAHSEYHPIRTNSIETNSTESDSRRAGLEPAPTDNVPRKIHGLPEIIRSFKTFSSRRINAANRSDHKFQWQRNYYEHIIRDDKSLWAIRTYIRRNPMKWNLDNENHRGLPDIDMPIKEKA